MQNSKVLVQNSKVSLIGVKLMTKVDISKSLGRKGETIFTYKGLLAKDVEEGETILQGGIT